MIPTERFKHVEVASLAELRAWLSTNHDQREGVWLIRYKKSVPAKFVDRLELLDELLCFGWVDGIARKIDEERTMQLIFPRKQQTWAQSYKDRAARLIAEGRMMPPGLAAIDESKRRGQWDAYAAIDALIIPDDLRAALGANASAETYFHKSSASYRRNLLRWVANAKRGDTRAKRIEAVVKASSQGEKIPQM